MDKETLSSYGWIVIATIVVSLMIIFMSPLGEGIGSGIEVIATNVYQTVQEKHLADGNVEFSDWKSEDVAKNIPDDFKDTGIKTVNGIGIISVSENDILKGLNGEANNSNYNFYVINNNEEKYRLSQSAQNQIKNLLRNEDISEENINLLAEHINNICFNVLSANNVNQISQLKDVGTYNYAVNEIKTAFSYAGYAEENIEFKQGWIRLTNGSETYCFPIKLIRVYN